MRSLIFLMSLFFVTSLFAQAKQFVRIDYRVLDSRAFTQILREFIQEGARIDRNASMIETTLRSNPHISDWRNIAPGEEVRIYIDRDIFDRDKYLRYEKSRRRAEPDIRQRINLVAATSSVEVERPARKDLDQEKHHKIILSSFIGSFSQEVILDGQEVTSSSNLTQNITLGYEYRRDFDRLNWSLLTRASYSQLGEATTNIEGLNIDFDPEYNFLFVMGPDQNYWNTRFFGGIDFESFNILNIESISGGGESFVDRLSVFYLQVRGVKKFELFGRPLHSALSFSYSLATSLSTDSELTQDLSYTGPKISLEGELPVWRDIHLTSSFSYRGLTSEGPDFHYSKFEFGLAYNF